MLEPFQISVSAAVLDDLRSRLEKARLPDHGSNDWEGGINPIYPRELVRHWRERFDWRAQEALLNRSRHFRTEVSGTRLHVIHEKGRGRSPSLSS